jgi:hypothetical protein
MLHTVHKARSFRPLQSLSRGPLALLFMTATAVFGCDPEFDPATTLNGYRVIGIEASPPEVRVDGAVDLSVRDYTEGSEPIVHTWSACLFSLGASVGYECVDPSLEIPLGTEPTARIDLGPNGLDLQGALDQLGEVPGADGTPQSLEKGIEVWIKLVSGPDCDGCERIESVKRVKVRDSDEAPNQNPIITAFNVEGTLAPESKLKLLIETDAPETYTDPVSGDQRNEEYLYTWYTTEGETDPGITFGDIKDSELKLPKSGTLTLFVAVRDERGGFTVERKDVTVDESAVPAAE